MVIIILITILLIYIIGSFIYYNYILDNYAIGIIVLKTKNYYYVDVRNKKY